MNAIFNLPKYARIGLMLFVIISLGLLFWQNNDKSLRELRESTHRTSDYAMTDFTMTIMDLNGEPVRVIKGIEMAHYPHDDSTEIEKPIAEFLKKGEDTWRMTADHGRTDGDGEVILLTGNVIIINKNKPTIQLLTEKLTVNTIENTAYTDQDAIIRSPHGDTNSVGLHADLDDETISLYSKVKGQYDAPPAK